MSELKRRHSALLESRRRRFHRAIELEDVATWALNLDKLGNARLRIRFDCRGKTKCSRLPSKFSNRNTGLQLKTDVERRLSAGRSHHNVVMVLSDRQNNPACIPLHRIG